MIDNFEKCSAIFINCLKHSALNKVPADKRKFYLQDSEFGTDVFRVNDFELEGWYGVIYTFNKSKYVLKEKMTLELKGAQVWPNPNPEIDIEI